MCNVWEKVTNVTHVRMYTWIYTHMFTIIFWTHVYVLKNRAWFTYVTHEIYVCSITTYVKHMWHISLCIRQTFDKHYNILQTTETLLDIFMPAPPASKIWESVYRNHFEGMSVCNHVRSRVCHDLTQSYLGKSKVT